MADATKPAMLTIVKRADAIAAGEKLYFTGEPCPRGHVSMRTVAKCTCVECHKVSIAEWRKRNPDKGREYCRRHDAKRKGKPQRKPTPEKSKQYQATYRAKLSPERREQILERDRVAARAKIKARTQADRDRKAANDRASEARRIAAETPEQREKRLTKVRAKCGNRRASVEAADGRYTARDVEWIFKAQRGKCAACRRSLKRGYHVDHIVALKNGGSNWPRNLQLLCPPCNVRKHAKDPIEFMQSLGKLL